MLFRSIPGMRAWWLSDMISGGIFDFLVRFIITFCPDLLHLRSLEVGELPETFVFGRIKGFVLFFKMNPHKVLPDGGVGFRANRTVNWHVGARRRGSGLCCYTVRIIHLHETSF